MCAFNIPQRRTGFYNLLLRAPAAIANDLSASGIDSLVSGLAVCGLRLSADPAIAGKDASELSSVGTGDPGPRGGGRDRGRDGGRGGGEAADDAGDGVPSGRPDEGAAEPEEPAGPGPAPDDDGG